MGHGVSQIPRTRTLFVFCFYDRRRDTKDHHLLEVASDGRRQVLMLCAGTSTGTEAGSLPVPVCWNIL
jgi:hypothetical protein